MDGEKRVALLLPRSLGYCAAVLDGIARYANEVGNWWYRGADPTVENIQALVKWKPHGIILGIWEERVAAHVAALDVPIIDVFDWYPTRQAWQVTVDNAAIGPIAMEHFVHRGFRQFAFVGELHWQFVQSRRAGFEKALAEAGHLAPYSHALKDGNLAWSFYGMETDADLAAWVKTLPKPIAILTANDDAGLRVLEVCKRLRLRVPDDYSVLGVDDNQFMCKLAHPPMSSVATNSAQIGFEAARLLDQAMAKRRRLPPRIAVPPLGVVARQSTDTLAIDDADVAAIIRTIRRSSSNRLTVASLLNDVPMRRRTVERRFRALLGHGIYDEIRRARVQRARELLVDSDLLMPAIAQRCGFSNAERFSRVFRKFCGKTPTAFRKQFRPES